MLPRLYDSEAIQGGVHEGEPASTSSGPMPPPANGFVYEIRRDGYKNKKSVYKTLTTAFLALLIDS